ncbi:MULTISPECIES: efflux RND transporter periplasmic adaptor subunit [unclassified Sphingobium]|jgi:RND family efflux transporter MFP subunit|uniref:efflux RND transporter periplasmic adaptor subunit n=1 Tax=unclassified Sphingobium TaxID=2611147 RepID=UPI000A3A3523|nr:MULTISPECIES: efflux RND transporter periplasmic adaptor subunit [unclassified Sphingobium]MBS86389.1 efflux RND transporter periplasmic adaptor subunit [Sphingobium sp.]MBS87398.1 efflux RND transporter periplasmic adaptor subunit [Sphingobium sp.]OUC53142.1 efflux transporter periplasmic adaptor subunit [Sphingobium sp. GW456-12-10-14-TSB1]
MSDPTPSRTSSRKGRLYGAAAAVGVALLVGGGIVARNADHTEQAEFARANALPTVNVLHPQPAEAGAIRLPGMLEPDNEAAIHARASGYVARRLVDIGDHVRAGQVLAVLDAPEVEQQLAQAQADLRTAEANRGLAQTTAVRWDALRAKDAVSQQETDEKSGRLAAATALASSARANVERLRATLGFSRVVAPFAGRVTSRNAEIGALVNAGNGAASPLFTIADDRRLRLRVRVPQALSGQLTRGVLASLTVPEYPGESFDAVLARTAGAVDRASGTVLAEFEVNNAGQRLKPGGYAEVAIPMAAGTAVTLPASALIVTPKGTMVGLVDREGRVTMRPVMIGRDDGASVQIASGLTPQARVIATPPEALAQGDRVRIVRNRGKGTANAQN